MNNFLTELVPLKLAKLVSSWMKFIPFPPHFIYPVISTQGSLQYTLGHFLSDTENLNLGLNKS